MQPLFEPSSLSSVLLVLHDHTWVMYDCPKLQLLPYRLARLLLLTFPGWRTWIWAYSCPDKCVYLIHLLPGEAQKKSDVNCARPKMSENPIFPVTYTNLHKLIHTALLIKCIRMGFSRGYPKDTRQYKNWYKRLPYEDNLDPRDLCSLLCTVLCRNFFHSEHGVESHIICVTIHNNLDQWNTDGISIFK